MEYLITSLKQVTSKRELVYINYEPAFALYSTEIRKFQLKEGQELDEGRYEGIEAILKKRATVRAMNLLKDKDYARKELIQKLEKFYYSKKAIEAALSYIDSYHYLDDARYANNYLAAKAESKSRRQIEQFLKLKGIDDSIIDEAMESYYGQNEDAELSQVKNLLDKKLKGMNPNDLDYNSCQKIFASIYRKGFEISLIRKAFEELCNLDN